MRGSTSSARPLHRRTRLEHAAHVMHGSGLGNLLRRIGAWRGTLVLGYHRIGDPSSAPGDRAAFSATPEQFSAQLDLLRRDADVISLEDVLATPPSHRPGRRVHLTFDDGYRDNFAEAFPRLRAAGLPATFFVTTGFIGSAQTAWWDDIAWMIRNADRPPSDVEAAIATQVSRFKRLPTERTGAFLDELAERSGSGRRPAHHAQEDWMTWDMVRTMRASGMAIGGHSHTHPVLARMPENAQARELDACRRRLEDDLGSSMRAFAYPVGTHDAFDDRTRRLLRSLGTEVAFALSGGFVARGRPADPLAIPRATIGPAVSIARFAALVTVPQAYARW